jgi:serine/threonine-protein kinase
MPKIIDRIDRAYYRLLTSQNRVLRTLDRVFEKTFGQVRVARPAPAGGPADAFGYNFFMDGGSTRSQIERAFDETMLDFTPGQEVKCKLDKYVVEKLWTEGGMARIYVVRDSRNQKHLLKVPKFSDSPKPDRELIRQRFQTEIEVMKHITAMYEIEKRSPDQRRVVKLIDWDKDSRYLVMEYIQGTNLYLFLRSLFDQNQIPPLGLSCFIVSQVLLGLMDYEAAMLWKSDMTAVAHRDIKPDNILLEMPGNNIERVLLSDFGIAKKPDSTVTAIGQLLGTPGYIPPEEAKAADQRSDNFSLGVMLHWMVTTVEPFGNAIPSSQGEIDNMKKILDDIRSKKPDWVPRHLWETVLQAMALDRDKRFESYQEFHAALEIDREMIEKAGR